MARAPLEATSTRSPTRETTACLSGSGGSGLRPGGSVAFCPCLCWRCSLPSAGGVIDMRASYRLMGRYLLAGLLVAALTAALAWQAMVTRAFAQESYPNRLVRMIVPFPAGGTADALPRIVAEKLAEEWRRPVIIDK